jgi:hypothetical protein
MVFIIETDAVPRQKGHRISPFSMTQHSAGTRNGKKSRPDLRPIGFSIGGHDREKAVPYRAGDSLRRRLG